MRRVHRTIIRVHESCRRDVRDSFTRIRVRVTHRRFTECPSQEILFAWKIILGDFVNWFSGCKLASNA